MVDDKLNLDRESYAPLSIPLDEHIRQYNILMEDTVTGRILDEDSPWEKQSKSKVSISAISPQPNLDIIGVRRDEQSGEGYNPYEFSNINKENKARPILAEDFSDMTDEFHTYKKNIFSNHNSAKNQSDEDKKMFSKASDRFRTFGD